MIWANYRHSLHWGRYAKCCRNLYTIRYRVLVLLTLFYFFLLLLYWAKYYLNNHFILVIIYFFICGRTIDLLFQFFFRTNFCHSENICHFCIIYFRHLRFFLQLYFHVLVSIFFPELKYRETGMGLNYFFVEICFIFTTTVSILKNRLTILEDLSCVYRHLSNISHIICLDYFPLCFYSLPTQAVYF